MAVTDSTEVKDSENSLVRDVQYPNSMLDSDETDERDVDEYDYLDHARKRVSEADMVVLSDGDADGIASAALVEYVFDSFDVAMIPVGPHKRALFPSKAMDVVANNAREDMTVFFLDTCLGDNPFWQVKSLADMHEQTQVNFFDHHEWTDEERVSFVQENTAHCELDTLMDTEWEINDEEISERCTAKMVYDYFVANGVEFPAEIEDRVEAVTVGDLWLKDNDEQFKHENTQFVMDSLEYVTDIDMEKRYDERWFGYGEWADAFCNTSVPLEESALADFASDYRERINARLDVVFENDRFISQYSQDGIDIAFVYGDVPPNDPATELRRDGVDLVVIMFPWMKCSLRGTENFDKCHLIAEELGGGGHAMASGATLKDINPYDSKEEYYEDCGEKFHSLLLERISDHQN